MSSAAPRPDLDGAHVLVTGASRGIGEAVAARLARLGARVTLSARGRDGLAGAVEGIVREGGDAHGLPADASDPDEVAALVRACEEEAPLWGCVHSAGGNLTGDTLEYAVEDFDRVMEQNARSSFLVLREVARRVIERGDPGRLVVISSQMGLVGYPGRVAYCSAKHAVNGMVKAMAVEWAGRGLTVNALAPTFVETPMTRPMLADPEFRDEVLNRIPAGRIGDVEEVAAAAAFLMDPAASLVTGAVLPVDGGWTAW